jgi:hypothetical protein
MASQNPGWPMGHIGFGRLVAMPTEPCMKGLLGLQGQPYLDLSFANPSTSIDNETAESEVNARRGRLSVLLHACFDHLSAMTK